jgi:hypothetical protein
MMISRFALAAIAVSSLALAGCQSERFSGVNTRPVVAAAPAPLPAAPAGQIQSSQLPPPSAAGTADPSQFPTAPGAQAGTQVAALPPQGGGAEVSAGSVAGVWNASVAGQSCRVATPQTRFGEGFRAGPLRCPAPLDGVRSWNVSGSQLILYGDSGSQLATLYSSGQGRFDGQTSNGQAVSLSR